VEIVKYYHAFLINSDLDIYYEPTDTAAICRTSSLVEELGQIEYIFSDKTGTLTCNMMEFKQCTIGGIQYGEDVPEDRRAGMGGGEEGVYDFKKLHENLKTHPTRDIMHHFLTLLAVCHTVIPEKVMAGPKDNQHPTGEIKYQAASPDEGALVEGAADLGYKFTNRTPKFIECEVGGRTIRYDILGVCEFNSTRKRMSIIVRDPEGQVWIYCKGADTVITERLAKHGNPFLDTTNNHLEEYASEGLRTLCLAMRKIPEPEFQEWFKVYDAASKSLGDRDEQLDKAAELIERDFNLLGATAIEDRLQDGVPETIHTLQTAGIKIW
jgi:phospholipid-transporting ATPase